MKNITIKPALFTALIALVLTSCDTRSKEQKQEDKLQAVRVYNPKLQGPGHETHENQFYISRGDKAMGSQMAAAAAEGDTTATKMAGDTLQKNN